KSSPQEIPKPHVRCCASLCQSSSGSHIPCTSAHSPSAGWPAASFHTGFLNLPIHPAATRECSASTHAEPSPDNPAHHQRLENLLSTGWKHSCQSMKSHG